jgi:hypothetical protein
MPASRTDPLGVTPTRRDAAHDLAVLEAEHLLGWQGDVVRPFAAQPGSERA